MRAALERLSRELARVGTGRTLYILDEPTTGLHFEDVKKLLDALQRLIDRGWLPRFLEPASALAHRGK